MKHQLEFEPSMSNFLDEGFSNAKGKLKAKRKAKKDLKSVCGKKPLLKKKRGDYDKCVSEYNLNKGGEEGTASATDSLAEKSTEVTTTTTTDAPSPTPPASTTDTTKTDDKATTTTTPTDNKGGDNKGSGAGSGDAEKKILGMKPMVAYGVFALVAVGGFFAIRAMMKGKGTPTVATI